MLYYYNNKKTLCRALEPGHTYYTMFLIKVWMLATRDVLLVTSMLMTCQHSGFYFTYYTMFLIKVWMLATRDVLLEDQYLYVNQSKSIYFIISSNWQQYAYDMSNTVNIFLPVLLFILTYANSHFIKTMTCQHSAPVSTSETSHWFLLV